jgi:DNA-binding MarR family transcriptional regulator
MALIYLYKDVSKTLRNTVDKVFISAGLTRPQGMMINLLHKNGEMTIGDLSNGIGLSNSTVSGIIDRLENAGIVERIRSKEDKRTVFVKLTPNFDQNYEQHKRCVEDRFEKILDDISDEDLAKITEGLTLLKKQLDKNCCKLYPEKDCSKTNDEKTVN